MRTEVCFYKHYITPNMYSEIKNYTIGKNAFFTGKIKYVTFRKGKTRIEFEVKYSYPSIVTSFLFANKLVEEERVEFIREEDIHVTVLPEETIYECENFDPAPTPQKTDD